MKIISWNVNGIRAWLQKEGTEDFLKREKPDIFCFQEIKANLDQLDFLPFPEYPHQFWHSAQRKGYSGTVVFSKTKPLSESYGIGSDLDNEGRVVTLEFKKFFLVNVYTPNSKPDLARLEYRYNTWDPLFLKHLQKLEKKKPVIVCGDLNVAHQEIDLKNPQANKTTAGRPGNAGFTDQERERFSDFLSAGLIDTFRYTHPRKVQYSWWSYRFNARQNNAGWRIDYFLASQSLKNEIKSAKVHDQILGSDHCPVSLQIF